MRKSIAVLIFVCALLLAGCGNVFEAEYSYEEPYSSGYNPGGGGATEIRNYNMLKSALVDLVNRHAETGAFRFSSYNGGSVADDLAAACLEIRTQNPLGAYAVETLTCDTSRIVSYYTGEVHITYKKTAEEIREIVGVSGLNDVTSLLRGVVTDYADGAVLRVYSAQVSEEVIAALVEEMFFADPVTVVTEPVVEISSYPNEGINRIYDIRLDYAAPAQRLELMSTRLRSRVNELAGAMAAETQPQLALDCAETLYGLLTADEGSYTGTAYGAIMEYSADSKGVALAYKALCDALGVECLVVRGNIGDMGAEEHFWNIIRLEGAYYHVDVSALGEDAAGAFLLDDESLWGTYLWDAEAYPACTGALRYTDIVPPLEPGEEPGEGEEEASEGGMVEKPEVPGPTDAPTEDA